VAVTVTVVQPHTGAGRSGGRWGSLSLSRKKGKKKKKRKEKEKEKEKGRV